MEDQAADPEERLLRALAETENSRKRLEREFDAKLRAATQQTLQALLPALDDLELCFQHAHGDPQALLEGVRLTLQQFHGALEAAGVVPVEAEVGEPFSPEVHEAVGREPTSRQPPNTIVKSVQSGYRYRGRLLRPARVVVAVAPG